MKLTFSLFDDSVADFEGIFLTGKLTGSDPYLPVPLKQPNENIRVYLQRNKRGVPEWIAFFQAHCDFDQIGGDESPYTGLWNQYNSLVIVFRVNHEEHGTRYLTLTQGFGHLALDRGKVEDDFGLTVTLKTISPVSIRGVDARDLGTRTQVKRLRTNFAGEVWEFDFDPEMEVVGGVVGAPNDKNLADHIIGSSTLSLFRQIRWDQLEDIAGRLLTHYFSTEYEKQFQFATNNRRLRNRAAIHSLDKKLQAALRDRDASAMSLVIPIDAVDDAVASMLHVPGRGRQQQLIPFGVEALFDALDTAALQTFDPRDLNIVHYNADGMGFDQKNLYKHIVFEAHGADSASKSIYILSDGGWYEVASHHVARVERYLAGVSVHDDLLPPFRWTRSTSSKVSWRLEGEDEYNARVADGTNLALFDRVLFREELGGQSKVEVCDLLGSGGRFFCVKKYSSSSTLSHLFAQGSVSVELFTDSQRYREFTAEMAGSSFPLPFDPDADRSSGLRLAYAIACPDAFVLPDDLPFFAKATLVSHLRKIRRCGFGVDLVKIVIPEPPTGPAKVRRRPKN